MSQRTRGNGRGVHGHSYSGSISQKAQLSNAYQELGKELQSKDIKQVGNYSIGKVIGEGSFGKVRLALHRLTSTRCAIKQIPRSLAPPLLTREIHHHRRLHHPHIVQLFEVIATEQHIWLISELCTGGELFDYLVEHGRLAESETRRIFGQLCLAVGYIHSKGVVHRDLKLENVLLDERCNVKVADFGFGREFEQRKLMETFCGTTGYAAPEMLAGRKYLGEEVDIWSLGVILFTLLYGSLPFDDDDDEVMKAKIIKGDYELLDFISSDARDLIGSILRIDPKDRLSLKQILTHPWFTRPEPDPLEYLPPPIPEIDEVSPTIDSHDDHAQTTAQQPPAGLHITMAESETSESSWHSTNASDTSRESGRTTPVTSEEGGVVSPSALDPTTSSLSVHDVVKADYLRRNNSEATLKRGSDDGSDVGTRPSSFRAPGLATHAESEDSPDRPSSATGSGFRFPALARTDSMPGSPILPVPANSRTPARTKRRSVSSTFSERLLLPQDVPALPDYAALLSEVTPEPMTTTADKTLLTSLEAVGLDVGQMTHSVQNYACDASGALWWMLKRKADERDEAEQRELAAKSPSEIRRTARGTSATPTMLSRRQSRRTSSLATRTDSDGGGATTREGERVAKRSRSPSPPPSPPSPTVVKSSMAKGKEAISPSLIASASAPTLAGYFTTKVTEPNDTSMSGVTTIVQSPSVASEMGSPALDAGEASAKAKRQDKQRSASVSMLQRATSAFGASTSSADGAPGRSTPTSQLVGLFTRKSSGALITEKTSRDRLRNHSAEGSTMQTASGSAASTPSKQSGEPSHTPMGSPPLGSGSPWSVSSPVLSSSTGTGQAAPRAPYSPSTSMARQSSESPSLGGKRSRASLFSTFKLWFNEDRRRRKRPPSSLALPGGGGVPSGVVKARPSSGSFPRGSVAGLASSPLKRPAMGHRRSSHQSRRSSTSLSGTTPGHGRRGSESSRASFSAGPSGTRTPPNHHHAMTTDEEVISSRPPSAQSGQYRYSQQQTTARRKPHHYKSSSQSSAGSKRSLSGGHSAASPTVAAAHTYSRRTPTSTQVRRVSGSQGRRHVRSPSGASSIRTSCSSRRSSISEEAVLLDGEDGHAQLSPAMLDDQDVIEEEPETANDELADLEVERERERARRKLSGEYKRPELTALTSTATARTAPAERRASDSTTASKRTMHHHHGRSNSGASTSSSHHPAASTVFVAHKSINVFGAPRTSVASLAARQGPKLRDVFAAKPSAGEDGDWIDEDRLAGFSSGFGQAAADSSTPSPTSTDVPALPLTGAHQQQQQHVLGEGRYAGLPTQQKGDGVAWRPTTMGRSAGPTFRAALIEEEEEEEDS